MIVDYIKGDATKPLCDPDAFNLLIHGCNDLGAWGAGFTGALDKKWPIAGYSYREWSHNKIGAYPFKLGEIQAVDIEDGLIIVNMITQQGLISKDNPTPAKLWAINKGMSIVRQYSFKSGSVLLHMPKIGCGLGGLKWPDVEQVLHDVFDGYTEGLFTIKVYEL